ncbi:MAG: hypothetical protein IIB08_05095, partial [Bacteroidetes bacterium]|nr:hypothetical protein [Bacteroidota bacterium]
MFFRQAGLDIDLAELDIKEFTAETGRISALRPRAGADVARKSPLFTAAEEELFARFG